MSKVFTRNEFIEKLKWLVNDVPNYYHSENGTWCNYNWNNNKFMMDCVVSIKGLLWGFKADKYKSHGGAIYGSNGVRDFTANGGINYCTDVSSDFSKIQPGEYMCMAGTSYEHAGACLESATPTKRGKAFECTAGWGVNRCVISEFDIYGNRYYNGVKNVAKWTKFGKLQYIDYSDTPTPPSPEPDYTGVITYQTFVGVWLPEVNKVDYTDDGYAGIWGNAISGFRCKPQYGELIYQAHELGGDWLEPVSSKDYSNGGDNSYAGIYNKPIDCIRFVLVTNGWVRYRVHEKGGDWLPWVMSTTKTGTESYAGIYGKEIDGIQMY